MKKLTTIKNFFLRNYPVVGILLLWTILLITNYRPDTFLVGWDSLQTELNPGLAVKRAFFSGWQEYQSLGLPAGMGHAADLLRSLVLWIASFVLPVNLVRYGFHMLMVLVGAVGILKLLELSGLKESKKGFAFVGALFYLLNYNLIQMMFLPYESFTIFAGLLPWQLWAFLRLFSKKSTSSRDWALFVLIFVLAVSQSQALQLFVVLMLSLLLITIGLAIQAMSFPRRRGSIHRHPPTSLRAKAQEVLDPHFHGDDKGIKKVISIFKRAAAAAAVIVLINSFWLFSQFYFLATSAEVVQTSKINRLSTQDVFYRNKDKGNIQDFVSYTGFFNDGVDRNQQPLFAAWKQHRESTPILILIYALSAISLLGMFTRSKYRLPFILLYLLVVVSLLNNVFPLDAINTFIRKSTFINQIFRSPFTKFSILYALVASYFFAYGAKLIVDRVAKLKLPFLRVSGLSRIHSTSSGQVDSGVTSLPRNILLVLLIAGTIIQALPAFRGLYISPEVKVTIPQSYFEMMKYFKSVDPEQRIALLPEYTHWGWFFNEWGYDGSGFIWYGIEQPILSRNFDMWSTKSEGYYWEMKNALEREDIGQVERVLEKYGVDYLIFDHSLSPVVASVKTIQDARVEELLRESQKIKFEKQWDFLTLYKVKHEKHVDDFVWMSEKLPNIGPTIDVTNFDSAYNQHGNYQTDPSSDYDMYYPFLDLTTQTKPENINWEMKELETEWEFTSKAPFDLNIPDQRGNARYVLYNRGKVEDITLPYTVRVKNNIVSMRFPKTIIDHFETKNGSLRYCVNRKDAITPVKDDRALRIEANNGNFVCSDYGNVNLDQTFGYILKIKNRNVQGQRLFFYALDTTKDQPYIEDRLSVDTQYYILGDKYKQGVGYSFTFQANSHKTIPSVNYLEGLSIYLMPYDVIKGLGIKMSDIGSEATTLNTFDAKKINYHKYIVSLQPPTKSGSTIVLNQAYHQGWHAYTIADSKWPIANSIKATFPFIFGKEVDNHVKVNNWANGWVLNESQKSNLKNQIVIVYLPQYLQYLGLIISAITVALVLSKHKVDKKEEI